MVAIFDGVEPEAMKRGGVNALGGPPLNIIASTDRFPYRLPSQGFSWIQYHNRGNLY